MVNGLSLMRSKKEVQVVGMKTEGGGRTYPAREGPIGNNPWGHIKEKPFKPRGGGSAWGGRASLDNGQSNGAFRVGERENRTR